MSYPSVDRLQQVLAKEVFHYAKDTKKASGRALGTIVEIITFYALKSWGLERNVGIEEGMRKGPQTIEKAKQGAYVARAVSGLQNMLAARTAFLASYYTGAKGGNQFTKVQMALAADVALQEYFRVHEQRVESWFNIITPTAKKLDVLKKELDTLKNKNWQGIVS